MTEITADELARKDEIHEAEQYRQLKENPYLKRSFAKLREGALHLIESADVANIQQVRDAQRLLKLISKLEKIIERPIQTGDMAVAQLIDLEERKKRGFLNFR